MHNNQLTPSTPRLLCSNAKVGDLSKDDPDRYFLGYGKVGSPFVINATQSPTQTNQKSEGRSIARRSGSHVEAEHDKFWGKVIAEDARKARLQSERNKIDNRNFNKNHVEGHLLSQIAQKQSVREIDRTMEKLVGDQVNRISD